MKGTYLKAFLVGAGIVLGVIAFIMGFFALWYAAIAYWYITIPLLVLWGGFIGVLIARDEQHQQEAEQPAQSPSNQL